jgi:hypothetical protein
MSPVSGSISALGSVSAALVTLSASGCIPVVYGHSGNQISKTISLEFLQEKNLPIYFDHQELVEILK